jgi:hypothetical protein
MIIYFHGFRSVGKGPKSQMLINKFGIDNVLAPDLPVDPIEVEKLINGIIRDNSNYPLIFVGTSLGGFWANYFSQKWDAPGVLINPLTDPSKMLEKNVYLLNTNYVTGKFTEVKDEYLKEFATREKYLKENSNGYLTHLFLSWDDEVIDPSKTIDDISHWKTFSSVNDGGHSFLKYWDKVIDCIEKLYITEKM